MVSLLMASLMCLPLAPFNPVEQDTLPSIALHFAVGVSAPTGVETVGPELSAKYEILAIHPLALRGSADYGWGRLNSRLFPQGDLHSAQFALEALYYRGTNRLLAYLGVGAVYGVNWFTPSNAASDSLWHNERVNDVDLSKQVGYRITLGVRIRKSYSIELSITELRPDIIKNGERDQGMLSRESEEIKTGSFKVMFGYVIPLKRF